MGLVGKLKFGGRRGVRVGMRDGLLLRRVEMFVGESTSVSRASAKGFSIKDRKDNELTFSANGSKAALLSPLDEHPRHVFIFIGASGRLGRCARYWLNPGRSWLRVG